MPCISGICHSIVTIFAESIVQNQLPLRSEIDGDHRHLDCAELASLPVVETGEQLLSELSIRRVPRLDVFIIFQIWKVNIRAMAYLDCLSI